MEQTSPLATAVMTTKKPSLVLTMDLQKEVARLIGTLDTRSRDIVSKRFNLDGKGEKTLEAIGSAYGITRERVRQIENAVLKKLQEKQDVLGQINNIVDAHIEEFGFAVEENLLVESVLGAGKNTIESRSALILLMRLNPALARVPESDTRNTYWIRKGANTKLIEQISDRAQKILIAYGKPLTVNELKKKIQEAEANTEISDNIIKSALILNKLIHKNPFEEWGLTDWRDIVPKGVRDKAFVVLKKKNEPLHFVQLTKLINEAKFDLKTAYPQTVHNELIKDNRFVLVGRGIYALKEWGYEPGTVAQVITQILKQSEKPLARHELIERVLHKRLVKKNTILLALQDKKKFKRVSKDQFTVAS